MAPGYIGVIGAGLAGLSAALELKRRGFTVDLLERSRLLGGKATSFIVGDVEVDNGQHVYLACCTEFVDFARQLGYEATPDGALFLQDRFDALLLAPGRAAARLRAVPLPAPWHLAPALLRYRHLRPAVRLRVALALRAARKPARPGETFASWLQRHRQPDEARTAFWDPFFVPALNAPLDQVSAEAALFVISTAFLQKASAARFGYARVPLARIAEAAADQLDGVYLRTPVARLQIADGHAKEPTLEDVVLEDESRRAYDAVVLAVPPHRLKRLLGDPEQLGICGLDEFHPAPIVDIHLWYDLPTFGFGFAALLDSPVQWVFEKGAGYLCCSMSAAEEYIGQPSADLIDLCHRELAAVLPALRGKTPLRGAVTRDREATFVPTPGLQRPGPVTGCPQVVLAGAWTDTGWPATMESAVRSGRAAARVVASRFPERQARDDGHAK
ncbi:MAG TPA: hydroxysqualene dehydroxylase HpnE [Chloroflexota bacterium]